MLNKRLLLLISAVVVFIFTLYLLTLRASCCTSLARSFLTLLQMLVMFIPSSNISLSFIVLALIGDGPGCGCRPSSSALVFLLLWQSCECLACSQWKLPESVCWHSGDSASSTLLEREQALTALEVNDGRGDKVGGGTDGAPEVIFMF